MGVDGRAVYHQVVSFDTLPYYWSLLERHYHIRVDRWNKPCREYARPLGNEYSELQSEPQDFTLLILADFFVEETNNILVMVMVTDIIN